MNSKINHASWNVDYLLDGELSFSYDEVIGTHIPPPM